MLQGILTLCVAGLGIAGTLGGVITGQRMSQSWQREQWLRDNRKEEFRELLNALADSFRVELTRYAGSVLSPEQQLLIVETHSNAMRIIRSRIFVADVVERLGIELKWAESLMAHNNTLDVAGLSNTFADLRRDIVKAARAETLR